MMEIASGLSTVPETRRATVEAALTARNALTAHPTLAVVFASPHHAPMAVDVLDAVHEAATPASVIGAVGEAIVGGSREIEGEPAVAVWLAVSPREPQTFHVEFDPSSSEFDPWPAPGGGTVLLVCDPFTFPADLFLRRVNEKSPGTKVIGGMASGAGAPGETRLFHDHDVHASGAVGAVVSEDVRIRTLVSQGCRPVGATYTVTKADRNVILELGGRPPLERIRELYLALDPREQALLSRGLHLGLVIDEYRPEFRRGDFLIRGVIGADEETGAIAVGDQVSVGETVQFHVRDAESADEDLRELLGGLDDRPPDGALLFTCNGRGSRMFDVPDHDASLVSKELGEPPVAGFFCGGELGPVGGRNFVHGFTASLALFYGEGGSKPEDAGDR